jgi:two-component system phosphate regulon sensor histidine kinase PhoR
VWTSKIFWKLFVIYATLSLTLAFGFLWMVSGWQRQFAVEQAGHTLTELARSLLRSSQQAADPQAALLQEVGAFSRESSLKLVYLDREGNLLAGDSPRDDKLPRAADVQNALSGKIGQQEQQLGNQSVLHVAVPIRQGPNVVGVLRVSQDLANLDQRIGGVERSIWQFAGVATCLALAAAFGVISQIVRPLTQLTEGAQAIAADDEEHPLAYQSADELGVLGNALHEVQRKLARRVNQLKENTERLATVLGSMVEGVIAVSTNETILLANEASRNLLDMTVADPVGRPLLEVTRSLPVHAAVVEALRSSQPVQREFEATGPTRRVLALRATKLPGHPSPGVMMVLHDVSELRRLENLRREFVANVSHELKTPLASIKAYAETLKMGALHDPEHSVIFVSRIEEQAERLHQLILDLLQIARVESGQEAFEIVDVDLADVVQDCLEQYADAAAAKSISLEASPAPSPVIVRADEEGIRTILSNLIDNAIKYTPPQGRVTVRWRSDEAMAVLEVEDTGIGIAEKDQGRIFERFYRVDKARSRGVGGTGLGLSIVKHLIQSFGGSIGLQSIPKQGSTFRLWLPRSKTSPMGKDQ